MVVAVEGEQASGYEELEQSLLLIESRCHCYSMCRCRCRSSTFAESTQLITRESSTRNPSKLYHV